jgi:hypothetical protein
LKSGDSRTVNRKLETTRALAGLKGYVTDLRTCPDRASVEASAPAGLPQCLVLKIVWRTAACGYFGRW